MNYNQALEYIQQIEQSGSNYGLSRVKELEKRVGAPSDSLNIVHVAGTNGKGSFCAFLSAILEDAAYVVGRYISPTILDYRERIQKNNQWIDKEAVANYISRLKPICEAMDQEGFGHPTAFEIETVMALMYFRDSGCNMVILEAGLGGQHDATNFIENPVLSVITSIGYDHTAILGNSLEAIGEEKAGIIKEAPVLVYSQDLAVMDIMENKAKLQGSTMSPVFWNSLKIKEQSIKGQIFDYSHFENIEMTMIGTYQLYNGAAAIKAAEVLNGLDFHISEQNIYNGIKKAKWPGRFEIMEKYNRQIVVDGAHNPAGAKMLADSLDIYFKQKHIVLIAGIFKDKDYQGILKELAPYGHTIITHKPPSPRGLDSHVLAETAKTMYDQVYETDTVEQALKKAISMTEPKDIIVTFGSLSTIKQVYNV